MESWKESWLTNGPDICVNICTVAEIYPCVGLLARQRSWIGRHIDPHAIDECFASTAQKRTAEIIKRRSRHGEKYRSFLRPQRLVECRVPRVFSTLDEHHKSSARTPAL